MNSRTSPERWSAFSPDFASRTFRATWRAGDPTSFRPDVVTTGEAGRVLAGMQVRVDDEAESHFPDSMDSRVTVRLRDGREVSAYGVGHVQGDRNLTPGARWEVAVRKFHRLGAGHLSADQRDKVVAAVRDLADGAATDQLMGLLAGGPKVPSAGEETR